MKIEFTKETLKRTSHWLPEKIKGEIHRKIYRDVQTPTGNETIHGSYEKELKRKFVRNFTERQRNRRLKQGDRVTD